MIVVNIRHTESENSNFSLHSVRSPSLQLEAQFTQMKFTEMKMSISLKRKEVALVLLVL